MFSFRVLNQSLKARRKTLPNHTEHNVVITFHVYISVESEGFVSSTLVKPSTSSIFLSFQTKMKVIALLSLFLLSSGLDGANILFLNTARIGQSHIFFMGKVADVLAEAGHNVVSD